MRPRFIFLLGILVFFLDRISKFLALSFHTYTTNSGAAFGLLQHHSLFLSLVAFLALVFFVWYTFHSPFYELGFLLGGTAGNLFDRLFFGSVIDFINLGFFPVFNYADLFNTLGILLLIYRLEFMHLQK